MSRRRRTAALLLLLLLCTVYRIILCYMRYINDFMRLFIVRASRGSRRP